MVFPVVTYGCERWTKNWVSKNWCFWTVVLKKTLESPLDCKEIQPVLPKGNQFCIFIGRTDAEAETPILWPPDEKNWLIGKDPDAGKDWRRRRRRGQQRMRWLDASETQWTWIWVNSGSWWWTGKPGMLQSTGSQRVGHDWVTELNSIIIRVSQTFKLEKGQIFPHHFQRLLILMKTVGSNTNHN